jgi:hypothetical protein
VWVKDSHWLVACLFPGAISQLTLRSIAARNRKASHFSALEHLGRELSEGQSIEEAFRRASRQLGHTYSVDGCFLDLDEPTLRLTEGLAADPSCGAPS